MADTINFWGELKKGLLWGAWAGFYLAIIISGIYYVHTSDTSALIDTVKIFFLVTIIGTILGGITALVILVIIGTLKGINWFFILLFGSMITILTPVVTAVVGWITLIVVPILYVVRKKLAEKAPQWLEQAVDQSMVLFLTSLIFTALVFLFQKFTGIPLIPIKAIL